MDKVATDVKAEPQGSPGLQNEVTMNEVATDVKAEPQGSPGLQNEVTMDIDEAKPKRSPDLQNEMNKVTTDVKVTPMDKMTTDVKVTPMDKVTTDVKVTPMDKVTTDVKVTPMDKVTTDVKVTPMDKVTTDVKAKPKCLLNLQNEILKGTSDPMEAKRLFESKGTPEKKAKSTPEKKAKSTPKLRVKVDTVYNNLKPENELILMDKFKINQQVVSICNILDVPCTKWSIFMDQLVNNHGEASLEKELQQRYILYDLSKNYSGMNLTDYEKLFIVLYDKDFN